MAKSAKRPVPLRLDSELADWVDAYAAERGVKKVAVHEAALRAFRADCESGVPDLEQASGGAVGADERGVRGPVGAGGSSPSPAPAEGRATIPDPGHGATRPARARVQRAQAAAPGVKTASQLAMERMHKMNPGRYGAHVEGQTTGDEPGEW